MQPNGKQLSHIVELIDSGKIKNVIHKVWPLEEARYEPLSLLKSPQTEQSKFHPISSLFSKQRIDCFNF